MSNLQDVPLAEPEVLPLADSEDAQMSKSNSLKRFFKVSKKPASNEYGSETSLEGGKELRKTSTFSRLFSRKKLPNKDIPTKDIPNKDEPNKHEPNKEEPLQSSSMAIPNQKDKPVPTPKPSVKASMSIYWKRLFHLHKTQNQDGGSGPEQSAVNEPEEVHELKLVQNYSEVQADLDEPDLEPKQDPESEPEPTSEPEQTSEPEAKKIDSEGKVLSALESGHCLAAEPKDGES